MAHQIMQKDPTPAIVAEDSFTKTVPARCVCVDAVWSSGELERILSFLLCVFVKGFSTSSRLNTNTLFIYATDSTD